MCEERFRLDEDMNIDEYTERGVYTTTYTFRDFSPHREYDKEQICDMFNDLDKKRREAEQNLQDYKDIVGSWFLEHNHLFSEDTVNSIQNELGLELPYYIDDKKPDIRYKPVKTWNENNDRFILTIDDEDSVSVYDNHKRDGYGLYCGNKTRGFMGDGRKISEENFKYLIGKLNDLYVENQLLKNNDEGYHKLVMDKIDKEKAEYMALSEIALEDGNKELAQFFLQVYDVLDEVQEDTIQGEEYE